MPRKKSEHYVNNKELLEALIVYRAKVAHAKENDLPKPRITNYLGECFLKIATHLSYKPNFVNYMFRDDMMELRIVFNTFTTLIPLSLKIHLRILHKLYIMLFLEEFKKRKNNWILKQRLLKKQDMMRL